MKTIIETIDPERAREYLSVNDCNRPLRPTHTADLAGMILRGQWKLTHQGIAFDEKAKLIDGQHRLHAIIESGQAVQMLVSRGVLRETYRHIDAGRRRTIGDRLLLLSDQTVNQIACAMVRNYILATAASAGGSRVSIDLIDNTFLSMSDEFTEVSEAFKTKVIGVTRTDVGAAVVCYMSVHTTAARKFLDGLLTGQKMAVGAPALALRDALLTGRIERSRVHAGYWKTMFATKADFEKREITALQAASTDWKGNKYDKLHWRRAQSAKAGAETKKIEEIRGRAK